MHTGSSWPASSLASTQTCAGATSALCSHRVCANYDAGYSAIGCALSPTTCYCRMSYRTGKSSISAPAGEMDSTRCNAYADNGVVADNGGVAKGDCVGDGCTGCVGDGFTEEQQDFDRRHSSHQLSRTIPSTHAVLAFLKIAMTTGYAAVAILQCSDKHFAWQRKTPGYPVKSQV